MNTLTDAEVNELANKLADKVVTKLVITLSVGTALFLAGDALAKKFLK